MNAQELYQKSENYLKQLLTNQLPQGSQFFLFGSRAEGKAGFAADIDIGILPAKPLDNRLLSELQAHIAESFIPYDVDLVDFSDISPQFKQQALKKIIRWN